MSSNRLVRSTAEPRPQVPALPSGWRRTYAGRMQRVFAYGSHIELSIEPRYLTKRAQRRRQPNHFRVLLRKRFYAHELLGETTPIGQPDTLSEAIEVAMEYMTTFVEDRREVAMETREDLEADPVMHHEAEETIVTEAALESAVEVAGCSETLLVAELRGLLESHTGSDDPVLHAVIHRDGTEYEAVYVADTNPAWQDEHRLREFYKQFEWLNEEKLARTLDIGDLTFMTASFEDIRLLRYLVAADRESVILIDPEYPVHLPPFERQIATLVSEKWRAA